MTQATTDDQKSLGRSIVRLLTLRRTSVWSLPGSAKSLALIWLGSTLAAAVLGLIYSVPLYYAGEQFGVSAAMVFAAVAATAILRNRGDPLRLAFGFVIIGLAVTALRMALVRIPSDNFDFHSWGDIFLMGWSVAAAGRLAQTVGGWAKPATRASANFVIAAIFLTTFQWSTMQARLSPLFLGESTEPAYEPIDSEVLWTAQPRLLAKAVIPLAVQPPTKPSIYILALATGGSQQLFGREARAVLGELRGKYGDEAHSALFSNARNDLRVVPLANRSNLEGAIVAMRAGYDPRRDLAVIYLTSHGGRDAALSTDLPDYTQLSPISAEFLAKTLNGAKITRRVVIVSACYSGTWIAPLASSDTIVITASATDRTSFGCDDSRRYTVFGQAIVESALDRGASWRDAFAEIKRRVAREEEASGATPSLPQAYIGKNMRSVWESLGATAGSAGPAR